MTGIVGTTGAASGVLGTITKPAAGVGGVHKSQQAFTSTGTWTKPSGILKVFVELVGGGGGASGHSECGGAGGYSSEWVDVTNVASVIATIGGPGAGHTYSQPGNAGGTTSFGNYLSAGGGSGGQQTHRGGDGGWGSGGAVNIEGGGGKGHTPQEQGPGAASYYGGSARTGHQRPQINEQQGAYGTGGGGDYDSQGRGQYGKHGYIIVWEYE